MDMCSLRPEQVQSLVNGEEVQIKYYTLEEYGQAVLHEVKLVPLVKDKPNENNCS